MIGHFPSLEKQFAGETSCLLPYLKDETITDILINGVHSFYIDQKAGLQPFPTPITTQALLSQLIERMVIPTGKRIDAAHPYLDGKLADGSRFHLILPPIATTGAFISIRKHKLKSERGTLLSRFGPPNAIAILKEMVSKKMNLLIAGATGVGKTTLLCELLHLIPETERILIIEETREIETGHPHTLYLEARPKSPDGMGEVSLKDLIRNALRMRPDRLILGECRGEEVKELLQALNTGHSGSLSTLHANSAHQALRRLETLLLFSSTSLNPIAVKEWIAQSIQGVVFLGKVHEERKIIEIVQVLGTEGDLYRILPKYQSRNDNP